MLVECKQLNNAENIIVSQSFTFCIVRKLFELAFCVRGDHMSYVSLGLRPSDERFANARSLNDSVDHGGFLRLRTV